MSLKSNRRDFLRSAALGIGTLGFSESLLARLFEHLTYKAFAQTLNPNPSGYYFHITFPGAPPRWMFDLPLTPSGLTSSNFINGGGFGTLFEKSGSTSNVTYAALKRSVAGKTLYLPPVWSYSTSKNFDSLLKHTLFIRGMDMEINSHTVSRQRQISPVVGGTSLNGAVADKSDRALPAITDGVLQFKSNRGLSPTRVSAGASNPISSALAPFAKLPSSRPHIKGQNLALQEQVLSRIESELLKAGYSENTLGDSYNKAADVIESNVQSLANNYVTVRNKYRNLISEALHPSKGSLPGLFSTSIPVVKTSHTFSVDSQNLPAAELGIGDLRDMISSSFNISQLAEKFAIMEILTDRLSTNFSMGLTTPSGLTVSGSRKTGLTHDQHRVGKHVSTLVTTLYYRAVLSCLTEFVDFLQGQGIFDESVIHISAEFNRTPRVDGTGSDHGWQGGNATLISGKFTHPQVIGNIRKQGLGLGTWGMGAPYYNDNGVMRPIKVNDVARTITTMLGVADVTTNGSSLLAPSSGGSWVVKKAEAKNV